jgi:RHS repeat-associated protein
MGSDRYTYDEMSRITTGTAVTSQDNGTEQFTYDGFGNLRTVTDPGFKLYVDTDTATNRLKDTFGTETGSGVVHTWGGSSGYDLAGNQLATNGTSSYRYDSMNMMSDRIFPGHEMYLYDADDERVAAVTYIDGQNSVWRYALRDETGHVLRTVTATISGGVTSWQQSEDYVYRGTSLLAAITPQGFGEARKHFHLDHLGSPVLITDDSGQRLSSHKYWPFGMEVLGGTSDGERMKFTGHERDGADINGNGLDYMHARYYNGIAGRFLSVDPTWESADLVRPQAWNRYAYVRNNPVDATDPDGRCEICLDNALGREQAEVVQGHMTPEQYLHIQEARFNGVMAGLTVLDGVGIVRGAFSLGAKLLAREGAEIVAEGAGKKALVQLNKEAGDAFRDEIAAGLKAEGRQVRTEVVKKTPLGPRRIDIEVSQHGKVLGGIETKVGNSKYLPSQRAKDFWLKAVQKYIVNVIRDVGH